MFFLPLIHTLPQTKSKINYKHQKLTTRTKSLDWWSVIVDRGLERRFGSVMWIGVDGDRWWIDVDQCWWSLVLMEIGVDGDRWWVDRDRCWWSACDGLTEIGVNGDQFCGLTEIDVDGVLMMVLLGWQRSMDWRGVVVLVMVVVLMEFLLWCFWVLNVRERRRKKGNKRKRKWQR